MFRAHTPSYLEANSISQPGSSVYTSLALANPAHWAHLPALLFGKGHPQLVTVPLLGANPSLSGRTPRAQLASLQPSGDSPLCH